MVDPIAHGYDWAWAQIGGESVKSNGGTFVVRYLGGSARLTAQERDNLHADGVNILLVWETAADATEGGYARGVADAKAANAEADSLGYPKDALLLYADDQNDPDPLQEIEYMKGVRYVDGRPSDLYSGGNVLVALDHAGLRSFGGWMVETWYPNAGATPFMVQLANTRDPAMVGVDAGQYDTNLLYSEVPMWGPDGTVGGDDMPSTQEIVDALTKPNDFGVSPVEVAVVAALDKKVSPGTGLDGKPWRLLDWLLALDKVQSAKASADLEAALDAALKNHPAGGTVDTAALASAVLDELGKRVTAQAK